MGKPLTKEEFIKRHSAFFQQLGFDVQFAGCIYYLLDLGLNDKLIYEKDDDFVIHRSEQEQTIIEYYQVKHSIDQDAKMTDADSDFWKTIDNWISLYTLSSSDEKDTFFTNSRFFILTNKKPSNFLYTEISKLKNGTTGIAEVSKILKDKKRTTNSYNPTLTKLINLSKTTLNQFLHKVEIVYFEDFIAEVYDYFVNFFLSPTKSDQIVANLIGELVQYKINCKGNFHFTGKEFSQKYKSVLEIMSDDTLTLDGYQNENSEFDPHLNYKDMPMVQQLMSIKMVNDPSDTSDYLLSKYLTQYYCFMNAYQAFSRIQLITDPLENKINKTAKLRWDNFFIEATHPIIRSDKENKAISDSEKIEAGFKTFTKTMNDTLPINGYKTDMSFSNGWYLRMSNSHSVVWHYDWYKKHIIKK